MHSRLLPLPHFPPGVCLPPTLHKIFREDIAEGPEGENVTLPTKQGPTAPLCWHAGASLKLSILNPKGRVWTMVAGGGASVIYADTVGDLGFAEELGNYAEYSGAPNMQARLRFLSFQRSSVFM